MLVLDVWSGSILVNLIIAFALATLTAFTLRKPAVDRRVALAFLAIELDLAIWSFGYLASYVSQDFAGSYFWHHVAFAAICMFGLFWLVFALASTGHAQWLSARRLALLAAPSLLLLLSAMTNDWHRLFFTSVSYDGPGILDTSKGPLYWVHTVLSYSYLALGIDLYLRLPTVRTGSFRWMKLLFALAIIPPVAVNLLVVLQVINTSIDLTPLMISGPVITCAIALFRYWLFDVVQSALAQATEQIGDAVVVVDSKDRILDANIAFCALANIPRRRLVGRSIHEAAAETENQAANLEQLCKRLAEWQKDPWQRVSGDIAIKESDGPIFELTVGPIKGPGNDLIGRVATLRDVTKSREVTHNLLDAVADLRVLHETALAITSMHDLGSVIGLILNEARRLTMADHASIATLDRNGNLTARAHVDNRSEQHLTPVSRPLSDLSLEIILEGRPSFVEDLEKEGAPRSSTMTQSTRAYA
ncbi:MAG: PAS domain-containing protein, partial [Chloroflexi bacterium]|nr:PAS domain-containing protein [Chloroflexota bacterium]